MKGAADCIAKFRKHATVEPGLTLFVVGQAISFTLFRVAIVDKICYQEIERRSANLSVWTTVASTITGIIATFVLSAWADRCGRKLNILIGFVGVYVLDLVNVIMIAIPGSPLWIVILANFVLGFTGTLPLVFVSCSQYVADTIKDKRKLVVRMTIVTCCFSFGFTIGALISAQIEQVVSVPWAMVVGKCISAPALIYFMLFTQQIPPHARKFQTLQSTTSSKTIDAEKADTISQADLVKQTTTRDNFLRYLWGLLKDIYQTYTKPRTGRKRSLLIVSTLAYMTVAFSSDGYEGLNATYISTPPLSFTVKTYPYYFAVGGLVITIGSMLGGAIFKKLQLSDSLIMVISMGSSVLNPLIYALATENWMIYLAPVGGCLGMLVIGAFQSFLVHLVEPDEVGKVLAGQALASKVADLLSGVALGKIFRATVDTQRNAAYLVSTGLMVVSTIFLIGVHFASRNVIKEAVAEEEAKRIQRRDLKNGVSVIDSEASVEGVIN